MRILTFNMRIASRDFFGKDWWVKRSIKVFKMLRDIQPDLVCLQESSLPQVLFALAAGYRMAGRANKQPILYKRNGPQPVSDEGTVLLPQKGKYKRYAHTVSFITDYDYQIVSVTNVHLDWGSNGITQNKIVAKLSSGGNRIVCGDMNSDPVEYPSPFKPLEKSGLALMNNPSERTFKNATLDLFFSNMCGYTAIINDYEGISDHKPVLFTTK